MPSLSSKVPLELRIIPNQTLAPQGKLVWALINRQQGPAPDVLLDEDALAHAADLSLSVVERHLRKLRQLSLIMHEATPDGD